MDGGLEVHNSIDQLQIYNHGKISYKMVDHGNVLSNWMLSKKLSPNLIRNDFSNAGSMLL